MADRPNGEPAPLSVPLLSAGAAGLNIAMLAVSSQPGSPPAAGLVSSPTGGQMFVVPHMPELEVQQHRLGSLTVAVDAADAAGMPGTTISLPGAAPGETRQVVLLSPEQAQALAQLCADGGSEASEEQAGGLVDWAALNCGVLDSGSGRLGSGSGDSLEGAGSEGGQAAWEDGKRRVPGRRQRRASWHAGLQGFQEDIDRDERRKERNRRAQRVFREKQKKRIATLEDDSTSLRDKVRALELKNAELKQENEILKRRMERAKRSKEEGGCSEEEDKTTGPDAMER